jgi:dienelactone hydrolase
MVHSDAACTPRIWTSDRYSQSVVESMAAALNRFAADHGYRHTVLVGYSGGGSLAMLMAPHIASITAVVTIAANLDVAAWTRWHDYLPLSGSLDPATQAPLAASIRQLHLVGGRDANVPESINDRFFSTLRPEQLLRFPGFDHVCCWVEQWADILPLIDALAITVDK